MRFVSFASSSKGNAALISYKNTNLLIDCGISKKRITENLGLYGLTLNDIDYILVTHSHADHIMGLPQVLKDSDVKVISRKETLLQIVDYCEKRGTKVNIDNLKIVRPVNAYNDNSYIDIKDIKMCPLKGTHDVESLYYKFILGDITIAIMTDMGAYTDYTINSLSDVNYLMLECNYDEQMLLDSSYEPWLKNRIMGKGGHLSNVDCSNIIMKIANDKLKKVYLSHISEDTNNEDYAFKFVTDYLKENYNNSIRLPEIHVAKRIERTEILV